MRVLIFLLLLPGIVFAGAEKPNGFAISSAHPLATEAGIEILKKGGNAFDAAITVASVLGVVAPYHSGLGGGGFWLLYDAKKNEYTFLDGRETAPYAATLNMYQNRKGEVIAGKSLNGGLSAAIPGQPAALVWLSSHKGRLPLKTTLAPAITLAQNGFKVDQSFHDFILFGDRLEQLKKHQASSNQYLLNDKPPAVGTLLKQPDLANTLKLLAKKGHDGFYRGEVANKLVAAVRKDGGIWTKTDLEHYQVKVRKPIMGHYHDMTIITAPPPSAGGISLITMLNILESYDLNHISLAKKVHYLVESMRLAYWQRGQYLGDPDYVTIPVNHLLSKKNAADLRAKIKDDKPINNQQLPSPTTSVDEGTHTTHFSIIDDEGNQVSATQTVNFIFGSGLIAKGTGVLLNDEMDDFSTKPGMPNVFGLLGSKANAIAPGKRPLSSMTPTFLSVKDRAAILGTPGGSRIPTMVLLASLVFHEGYGALTMVSAMRFHHQFMPDWITLEPDSLPKETQNQLKEMGYQLLTLQDYYGDMQAISWDKEKNFLTAGSDPRHIGLGIAINRVKKNYGVGH